MAWFSGDVLNAMERIRARLKALLDERQLGGGTQKQKKLAEFVAKYNRETKPRSQAWISNILNNRRDLRLDDLDAVAEFFRLPPAELLRRPDDVSMELSPTERLLIRNLRRMDPVRRDSVLNLCGVSVGMPGQKPPIKTR
jgi:transcriptional regulator with XRE-family HTH domain